jgi:Holliday junction resolvasome RuvABC endonuclease subunit
MRILGLDPGFTNLGWCVAIYNPGALGPWGGLSVHSMGCIETKKDPRKVLASVDNVRRAQAITRQLRGIIWGQARDSDGEPVRLVDAIAIEAMSFPPNASSAAKMSLCWGVISAVSHLWQMPMIQASPQDIKESVTGSRKASKALMETTLSERYPEVSKLLEDTRASRREHPYDALGAIVASLGSEVMKMGVSRG